MEQIKQKYGRHSICLAAEGSTEKHWKMKSEQRSPNYTTNWDELPIVKSK